MISEDLSRVIIDSRSVGSMTLDSRLLPWMTQREGPMEVTLALVTFQSGEQILVASALTEELAEVAAELSDNEKRTLDKKFWTGLTKLYVDKNPSAISRLQKPKKHNLRMNPNQIYYLKLDEFRIYFLQLQHTIDGVRYPFILRIAQGRKSREGKIYKNLLE